MPETSTTGEGTLVEHTAPIASYPAYRPKQIVSAAAAVVLVALMFAPWWRPAPPLNRVYDALSGWQLLSIGTGVGGLAGQTGNTTIGNLVFGLMPTLPVLVLAIVLLLRIPARAGLSARILQTWAIVAAAFLVVELLLGATQVGDSNGVYPVLWGAWAALLVSLATAVLAGLWWRGERVHFPERAWFGLGPRRVHEAEHDAAVADAGALFAELDEQRDFEDEPVTMTIPTVGDGAGASTGGAHAAGASKEDAEDAGTASSASPVRDRADAPDRG